MDGELWHIVEAKRDDGTPTMFRIRELEPQRQLTRIFVVELPYPTMELSRLPTADAYRRLGELEEQWLRPACASLGWEIVGSKTEDGSFFLYMYGSSDPNALVERISPFDAALGFYDDDDPEWLEYATLRELLDQAKAMPALEAIMPDVTVPVPVIANVVNGKHTNGTRVAPPKAKSAAKTTAPIRKPRTAKAKTSAAKTAAKKATQPKRATKAKAKAKAKATQPKRVTKAKAKATKPKRVTQAKAQAKATKPKRVTTAPTKATKSKRVTKATTKAKPTRR